jgi:hypothetical protein
LDWAEAPMEKAPTAKTVSRNLDFVAILIGVGLLMRYEMTAKEHGRRGRLQPAPFEAVPARSSLGHIKRSC